MIITRDTEGKLDARIFLSAIASRYKNRRYLHVAAQRRPRGRGYTLWYRAARKSRTWLKGQRMEEVERERERKREREQEETDIGESQQTAVLTLWVHCGGSKAAA